MEKANKAGPKSTSQNQHLYASGSKLIYQLKSELGFEYTPVHE